MLAALNDVWARAALGANTLRQQLADDHAAAYAFIRSGSLASVGKNSTSQAYKGYGPGSITQVQNVEIIGNLIGLYDQLKSKITELFDEKTDEYPDGVPSDFDFDQPIYDLLTRVFNALSSGTGTLLPDISSLRLPPNTILNPSLVTW